MRILGANKGETGFGKPLADGGVAVIEDDELRIAIAEERLSRQKWAGGFASSLVVVLKELNVTVDGFDLVVLSTCCESEKAAASGHPLQGHCGLITVNHHLSHAYQAFFQSGFEDALVVVIDGGGNTFESNESQFWWQLPREQHSYFFANKRSVELVDRDFFDPYEVGFGELYRAFTHYLGFLSGRFASKTMALAAFGKRDRFRGELCFEMRDGHLLSPIANAPNDPIGMIRRLGRETGLDFGEPREPGEEILPIHKDLAAYIQRCVEDMLLVKLRWLKAKFPTTNLCLSGGFFLNCVVNGRIASQRLFENVYIPSAPSDSGQCIGNAIYGALSQTTNTSRFMFTCRRSENVALGPEQPLDYTQISSHLINNGHWTYIVFAMQDLPTEVAKLLSSGASVAVFRGRSESGPRALGHRSILSDPRNEDVRGFLNPLKSREWFMPFAPTVLKDRQHDFFEIDVDSPFMSFAIPATKNAQSRIPAVVNKDSTSRLQTVDRDEATFIGAVLAEFENITGMPLLLNTSFNCVSEPIVESLADAVQSFAKMPINTVVLGDFLVIKKLVPELMQLGLLLPRYTIPFKIVRKEKIELSGEITTPYDLIRWIQEKIGKLVFIRQYLPLYREYIKLVDTYEKQTTTRFRPNSVEIPARTLLPLIETGDFGKPKTRSTARWVQIEGITYQRFGELTETDARNDGFNSIEEMRETFTQKIYPGLKDSDWGTIYTIHLNEESMQGT